MSRHLGLRFAGFLRVRLFTLFVLLAAVAIGSPFAYALPGDWNFYESQPRLATGVVGYAGTLGTEGTASIANIGGFGSSAWYSAELPAKAYTIYDVSVRVRAQGATAPSVSVHLYGPNVTRSFPLKKGTYASTTQTVSFITPAGTTAVRIYLESAGGGTIWFEDVTLTEVPFASRTTMVRGATRFLYTPRAGDSDPALAASERDRYDAQGYILYRRIEPRLVYPESIPQPQEITNVLRATACPGQQAGLWFSAYGLRAASHVAVEMEADLVAEGGRIPRSAVELELIRFWPQRTTWASTNYYVIPELLEPLAGLTENVPLPQGKSQGFWIRVKVPSDAKAGTYRGKINVRPQNGMLMAPAAELAIELEILPFALESPAGIHWMLYADLQQRYLRQNASDDVLAASLAEVKSYGITGIVDSVYYRDSAGKLSLDLARKLVSLIKNADLPGPIVFGSGLHYMALEELGMMQPAGWSFMTYNALLENPELQSAYRAKLSALDSIVRGAGISDWYYYLVDEPATPQTLPLAQWESRNAKMAGVKSYATLYPLYELPKLLPTLNVMSAAAITATAARNEQYRALTAEHEASMWHLGAGIYTGQEGGLMPNRYEAGFLFYKSGAKAEVSWTYQTPKGDPFDDFDGTGSEPKDACIAYPARKLVPGGKVDIATLQWEGIREGIDDYKYLHTLKQWIARAKQSGQNDAAASAQTKLDNLVAGMPWLGEWNVGESYLAPGNFTNETADQARKIMASEIVKLKALVEPAQPGGPNEMPGAGNEPGNGADPKMSTPDGLAQGCNYAGTARNCESGLITLFLLAIALRLKTLRKTSYGP